MLRVNVLNVFADLCHGFYWDFYLVYHVVYCSVMRNWKVLYALLQSSLVVQITLYLLPLNSSLKSADLSLSLCLFCFFLSFVHYPF